MEAVPINPSATDTHSGSIWSSLVVKPGGAGQASIFASARGHPIVTIEGTYGTPWKNSLAFEPPHPEVRLEPAPASGRWGRFVRRLLGLDSYVVRATAVTPPSPRKRSVADVFPKYSNFTTNILMPGQLGSGIGDGTLKSLRWHLIADEPADLAVVCGYLFYSFRIGGRIVDEGTVGEPRVYDTPLQVDERDSIEMVIGVDGFNSLDLAGSVLVKAAFDGEFRTTSR